ncbi:hypothetical protein JAAARDRAFT_199247 [Jaapia argillacea MUCL 33604]|uniref:BTB domain-containing protein n=1 Tax=Jaapia argillacea MUCL 33604 TaxID=933084 RepID=A0A067P8H3_9AGAM|nr:hypothetical protein JAAARDRAFT_199247 [Jaapia argillacea MUCL 33604]
MSTRTDTGNPDEYGAYYFEDVIFLVEDQLFKVPRLYFENHSDIFRDMFQLPTQGADVDGSSDENPLRLEGIKKKDFVRLLRIMYPKNHNKHDITTSEEWLSILKLSSMWNFETIRDTAIRTLSSKSSRMKPISVVDRMQLGMKYHMPMWVAWGATDLAKRLESVSVEEAKEMGVEFAIRITQVRERWHRLGCTCNHPLSPRRQTEGNEGKEGKVTESEMDLKKAVVDVFQLNEKLVEEGERKYGRVVWDVSEGVSVGSGSVRKRRVRGAQHITTYW